MIQVGYVFYVTIPTPINLSTSYSAQFQVCAVSIPSTPSSLLHWELLGSGVIVLGAKKKKLLHIDFTSDIWLVICILGIFFTPSPSYVAGGKYIVSDFPAKPFAAAACTMYHLNIN